MKGRTGDGAPLCVFLSSIGSVFARDEIEWSVAGI